MKLMVITNQKPLINKQISKRKEMKHINKESQKPQGKRAREKERNRELLKHPEKK